MNASKVIISIVKRSYSAQRKWKKHSNPGIQSRLTVIGDELENDVETAEDLYVEDGEPDFMQAHKSYSSYKTELSKNKELLKLRIVARKYFKEAQPNLLTYVEKEQIRHLHDSDSQEYTPEQLSESFPALPHTIRKILKAKWTPRSAGRVLRHDEQVIENWKKFNRGELPLEPRLREHLQKFKGRIIKLPNKEELEKKFTRPEKTFEKPKSQLYSGIIQKYLEQQNENDGSNNEEGIIPVDSQTDADLKDRINDKQFIQDNSMVASRRYNKNERILNSRHKNQIAILTDRETSEMAIIKDTRKTGGKLSTLDEFFKSTVENIHGEPSSIEDKVLLDTYRRKIESDIVKEENTIGKNRSTPKNVEDSSSVTLLTDKDVQVEDGINQKGIQAINSSNETGLETYVKIWVKKDDQSEDYPDKVNIPKAKYKKGKLYKLRDCYYDHDGEFLYRVPGLVD